MLGICSCLLILLVALALLAVALARCCSCLLSLLLLLLLLVAVALACCSFCCCCDYLFSIELFVARATVHPTGLRGGSAHRNLVDAAATNLKRPESHPSYRPLA